MILSKDVTIDNIIKTKRPDENMFFFTVITVNTCKLLNGFADGAVWEGGVC